MYNIYTYILFRETLWRDVFFYDTSINIYCAMRVFGIHRAISTDPSVGGDYGPLRSPNNHVLLT